MYLDAVAAFGQAPETELIFIEAPDEHRAIVWSARTVARSQSERGQTQRSESLARSQGESEVMSMSEVLKEAKLMQYNIEFCGVGLLPIVLHTDADVATTFCHKRGVGRMKHLDVKHCWLHEELEKGNFEVKRVDKKLNASDMLTHSPSAEELRKFLPMIGCHTMTANRKENCNAVKSKTK